MTIEQPDRMNSQEKRAAVSLALIYAFRMMGLFMVLPVLALYAEGLIGTVPFLIGLAMGVYGLTQAVLQVPFGLLSDRFGRKPVITLGLLLFAAGSLVAALSGTIYGLILGRALQGAGAIASVVMALAADLTRPDHRTKVMAVIGISIGASFMLSLVLGPLLGNLIGVSGIFMLTMGLALFGVLLLNIVVPNPEYAAHSAAEPVLTSLAEVVKDINLIRLNAGILVLHFIVTAGFIAFPFLLRDVMQINAQQHWQVYFWVLLGSLLLAIPCIMASDRRRLAEPVMLGAMMVLALALWILAFFSHLALVFWVTMVVFFAAFNVLEASLPAMVSKRVDPARKGAALGFYSSSQFLGAFLGGVCGGYCLGSLGAHSILLMGALLAMVWFVLAVTVWRSKKTAPYRL